MARYVTARELARAMTITSWMKYDENGFVKCFRNSILRRIVENVLRLDTGVMLEFIRMYEEYEKQKNT